jgi:predicted nucleotidyltransferase
MKKQYIVIRLKHCYKNKSSLYWLILYKFKISIHNIFFLTKSCSYGGYLMRVAGIIAEYNPFHKGHAYHIEQTRSLGATHIVAVMSGCFTQRGEAALFTKLARCKAALFGGADLVLELPVPWATASAEGFAFGAVSILDALGCVDTLSFGSESANIEKIAECARLVLKADGSPELASLLKTGISFPKARELAVHSLSPETDISCLNKPNDTLAVEYIKALIKTQSKIQPIAIARLMASHDDNTPHGEIASASFIRGLIASGRLLEVTSFIPTNVASLLDHEINAGHAPYLTEKAELLMLAQLRRLKKSDFCVLPDVNEGIENRILKAIASSNGIDEIIFKVKTKRYTLSRIRRIMLYAYLKLSSEYLSSTPPYIRVLGFNNRGRDILRLASNTVSLPTIMRYADINALSDNAKKVFKLECISSDLYGLCLPQILHAGLEQKYSPFYLNS